MKTKKIEGIVPVMITPIKSQSEIDVFGSQASNADYADCLNDACIASAFSDSFLSIIKLGSNSRPVTNMK